MKKSTLLCWGLFMISLAYSQSSTSTVISTSGDHFKNDQAQLSWTIGEVMVHTLVSNDNQLTQGFHQTNLFVTSIEDLAKELTIKVFPNPTSDILYVEWSENNQQLDLRLLDGTGRELWQAPNKQQAMPMKLDLSAYATGNYYLHIYQPNSQKVKTFKILKHQKP